MNSADSFAQNYAQARAKFLAASAEADGVIESIAHPERGPDGAAVYVDVARFGPAKPDKLLILVSGTHGVEGFCGSGAQVDFLRRGEVARAPASVGVLMIHAINPHGFAWLRRVTHENVDLNRNWIDFAQPLPVNAAYAELSEAICPREWTPAALDAANAILDAFAAGEGLVALNQAMSGGQYSHPDGIFYGGIAPSWSRTIQTQILDTHARHAEAVAIIDYHSGIGPWGYAERISTAAPDSASFRRAMAWYGATVASTVAGTTDAARIAGDSMSAASDVLLGSEVTAIALEVGTLPRAQVRLALRADTWLHTHGDPLAPEAQSFKREIRAAYYGDADDWKGMVAGQSLLACRQALAGLSGDRRLTANLRRRAGRQ